MQQLVDILEDYLKRNFNEDTLKVFRQLWGKSNVSEFDIAEHLRLSINYVRNLLYGLHAFNLVNSTRKKDRQKGWYIYYWTFKPDQIRFLYKKMKLEELDKLKDVVKAEKTQQFFVCANECARMDFEQAINFEYRCPECGELTVQEGHDVRIKESAEKIVILEKELKTLT